MDTQLEPIELDVKKGMSAAASLKYNNRFACLTGTSEFALASIDDRLRITFDVIREGIPGGDYSGIFGADETGKFMWCKSGWREAIIVDTESKKLIQKLASSNGNTMITAYIPVIAKENFVYVSVLDAGDEPQVFSVFDFNRDGPVAQIDKIYFCTFLQKEKDSSVIVMLDKETNVTWANVLLTKNDIVFLPDDNFTKELTKMQVRYSSDYKAFNFEKGILIGKGKSGKWLEPFSVRWNPEKTDIKIEPIILQCPKPAFFGEEWAFSLDGNWCMNKVLVDFDTEQERRLIVFYQVNNAFPNGLSLPVYGGITSDDNRGCFINHGTLGPLYLDITPSYEPVIYKLNQIPGILMSMPKRK